MVKESPGIKIEEINVESKGRDMTAAFNKRLEDLGAEDGLGGKENAKKRLWEALGMDVNTDGSGGEVDGVDEKEYEKELLNLIDSGVNVGGLDSDVVEEINTRLSAIQKEYTTLDSKGQRSPIEGLSAEELGELDIASKGLEQINRIPDKKDPRDKRSEEAIRAKEEQMVRAEAMRAKADSQQEAAEVKAKIEVETAAPATEQKTESKKTGLLSEGYGGLPRKDVDALLRKGVESGFSNTLKADAVLGKGMVIDSADKLGQLVTLRENLVKRLETEKKNGYLSYTLGKNARGLRQRLADTNNALRRAEKYLVTAQGFSSESAPEGSTSVDPAKERLTLEPRSEKSFAMDELGVTTEELGKIIKWIKEDPTNREQLPKGLDSMEAIQAKVAELQKFEGQQEDYNARVSGVRKFFQGYTPGSARRFREGKLEKLNAELGPVRQLISDYKNQALEGNVRVAGQPAELRERTKAVERVLDRDRDVRGRLGPNA